MRRAIAYCRVSTAGQARDGLSLEAQRDKLAAYAKLHDLRLTEIVEDAGASAGKPLSKREGGRQIIRAVKRGNVEAVVSYKLDRLFRNATDCLAVTAEWDKLGVALHLLDLGGASLDTSTPMGRFFLTVMAGAAEMERALASERTTAILQHKREKGERTSRFAPYGFKIGPDGKTLLPHPEEAETLRYIHELREAGLTLRGIVEHLEGEGIAPRGARWHLTSVARLLKRHE